MNNIITKENELRDIFIGLGDDWQEKYGYLIEMGRTLPEYPVEFKKDICVVRGCQSQVWVNVSMVDGLVKLKVDSDALIVKGLLAIILFLYDNQKPEDIINHELKILEDIGLNKHLSPMRQQGLDAVVNYIRLQIKKNI